MKKRSIFDGTISPKNICAFEFSFETLAERNKKLYFWTFTPQEKVRDEVYSKRWRNFLVRLGRYVLPIDFEALRVYERWDDGFLHSHMVCNTRLPVKLVRYHAQKAGLGWMHASEITDQVSTARYCAKYLAKKFRFKGTGIRYWAAIGKWPYTRVKDVQYSTTPPSPLTHFLKHERRRDPRGAWLRAVALTNQVDFGYLPNPLLSPDAAVG